MKILLGIGFFLTGCLPYAHPMRGQLDACNFHIGQYGVALRWNSLPVPIVLNKGAMNQNSIDATAKVADEWNDIWRRETGGQLFEVLGLAEYQNMKDIFRDQYNSVSLVDSHSNKELSDNSQSKYFADSTQGVTQVLGRRFLDEGDILLNDDDFDFYYEDEQLAFDDEEENERQLASTHLPSSNFLWDFYKQLSQFLFFWKKQTYRDLSSKRIPAHLVDYESLIAHEMGHLLGLGHLDISGSIMKPKMMTGVTRRGLNQVELNSLKCGYLENGT